MLTVNPTRLNRTLEELGRFGETPQGMQRLAFSPADVAGREYTMSLMRRAGLEIRIDPAGNIIGRKPGSVPGLGAIALGSHTDTVPNGGKYDGALGVMAAIEGIQTLADQEVTQGIAARSYLPTYLRNRVSRLYPATRGFGKW